jgi:UDP-2-acetamido-2-deoxy-ribo-hexuluronate aminotransferase
MQFIDLKAQQGRVREQIDSNIRKVLDHGKYIMGPEVYELEGKLADYVGINHCIAVSSGSDALLIAMMALGIKPGDEVITTPFTFIATGEMIALLGARPVYVDIDAKTYNIDAQQIERAITPDTRAIMPVSLYGQCSDMDEINSIADRHGLLVIEDAAQSFGATYKGKRSCSLSTIGCTSFFPSKPLGGYGDSGACFTSDDELAKVMREIRVHGQDRRYHHSRLGVNGRMDTLQAAILLAKMDIFPEEVRARQEVGTKYTGKLDSLSSVSNEIITPFIDVVNTSVYAQYTIQIQDRQNVQVLLEKAGVPTAVHYSLSLNLQPALASEQSLPVCEKIRSRVLSLPMHPYMTDADIDKVTSSLKFKYD